MITYSPCKNYLLRTMMYINKANETTLNCQGFYTETACLLYYGNIGVRHLHSKATWDKGGNVIPSKTVGENKHNPPANKEWSNSVYAYNKNLLRSFPVKDLMANKAIKSYFYLNNCKDLARSKRMRSLIRKSTVGKLFVSKPEIKQTGDKALATIYTFDKERQFLLRKIYFNIRKLENFKGMNTSHTVFNAYDNWRRKFSLKKDLVRLESSGYSISDSSSYTGERYPANFFYSLDRKYYLKNRLNLISLTRKRVKLFNKSNKRNKIRRSIPYSGIKLVNEAKFLRYITRFDLNNIQARKRVFYAYMKRMLSLFNVKVLSFDKVKVTRKKNRRNNEVKESIYNSRILRYKGKVLFFIKGSSIPEVLSIDNVQGNLAYLDKVNLLVSSFLDKILNKYGIPSQKLSSFLLNFSKANFKKFLHNEYEPGSLSSNKSINKAELDTLRKELLLMSYYINLKVNRLKFSKYLPALKLVLSKIYNKNVELNIVNLKYPYLNTDIFTEAIATKLRKKVGLLKVIRKSLKLVRTPYEFNERTSQYDLNRMQSLNIHRSLELSNLRETDLRSSALDNKLNSMDNLQLVLGRLYPRSLINGPKVLNDNLKTVNEVDQDKLGKRVSAKVVSVLNTIRYKWVTGVRLEAAGRLTRRYTASRSVYKFRYKGSLKDTDYSRKLDFLKKSMPVIKLRNQAKANSQYTYTQSKRRIGAFGIKGWISTY